MNNTVIGEIYFSLSDGELKNLDFFIQNSQWQYRETIVKCHSFFHEHTIDNSLDEMDKKNLFQYIYEEEPYNDSKLRFVLNRLGEAVKEWTINNEIADENIFIEKIWMDFLVEKKLRKNIQYNLDKNPKNTISEYRYLHQYFKSQENNYKVFNYDKDVKKQFASIKDIMKNAELFSDLVFIKNYCSLIAFTNVYQSIPDDLPTTKLNEIKAKKWNQDYPEFEVYLSLLDLLLDKDNELNYFKYKETLFKHFQIWEDDEKVNFLIYLLNFSSSQINKGKTKFIDEQYDLFQYFEREKIFQLKSYINTGRINNVIFIYLRKKEYKKATDFINSYISLLPHGLQESCKHFNLARIQYEKAEYKDSLKELLQVDFNKDSFYSLNSKLLLLKNYYELNESDAFDSLCNSFKEFIRKNKVISDTYKTNYINFIKMVKRMYQANISKRKKLLEIIQSSHQIAEKNWLLEKVMS